MSDPREAIFASVARRQAGLEVEPGGVFVRDGGALVVTSTKGERIVSRLASGTDVSETDREFRSRAVEEALSTGGGGNYLDNVWQLANSIGVPRDVRAIVVQRAARRAPSEADRLTVYRWSRTLSSGGEPRRQRG